MTLTTERLKALLDELKSWQYGYDPVDDKEQFDMLATAEWAVIELLANREAQPVAWTDAEELRNLEKDGCGAMLSLEKCKGGDPRRQVLLFTHPAPETELKAVVERLNASGYEYEDGPVTTRNASAVVEIVLQQLDDAVKERDAQPAPAAPEGGNG